MIRLYEEAKELPRIWAKEAWDRFTTKYHMQEVPLEQALGFRISLGNGFYLGAQDSLFTGEPGEYSIFLKEDGDALSLRPVEQLWRWYRGNMHDPLETQLRYVMASIIDAQKHDAEMEAKWRSEHPFGGFLKWVFGCKEMT